ncbi:MAG: hypothetical protein JNL61_13640 [Rhizobiaceae bacterium]|nr:hypothetical protein [Rhizobiaceae bacterium]
MRVGIAPGLALIGLVALAGAATAQEKAFTIELNDAQDIGGGCRLVYVATNDTGVALKKASYDVFTFKSDGKVGQSLVFQFGAFPVGKTKVVQFDLAGQPCSGLSRLLVNDVTECQADGDNQTICMDALKTTTRTAIGFGI